MKSGEKRSGLLIGRYSSKVSVRGRVAVPARFRDWLGRKAVLSQGYEKTLLLVTARRWGEITSFLTGQPMVSGGVRDTERFLFGSAYEVEFDDQGRMVVPQELRLFAGLGSEAVFLGLGSRVEIWSRENWSSYEKGLTKNIEATAARLAGNDGHGS